MTDWSREILPSILQEIKGFFGEKIEGIISFGSNAQLDNKKRLEEKDLDILIVLSDSSSTRDEFPLKLISNIVYKYKVRLDIHVYTLSDFARGLRNKDLLFLGISKNYKILHATDRFNTITQLLKDIGRKTSIKIHV
ncbi:MAG: nucleotidyltransferase domain-containing protein [Candidatus Hodarchaeales archaeon]